MAKPTVLDTAREMVTDAVCQSAEIGRASCRERV